MLAALPPVVLVPALVVASLDVLVASLVGLDGADVDDVDVADEVVDVAVAPEGKEISTEELHPATPSMSAAEAIRVTRRDRRLFI